MMEFMSPGKLGSMDADQWKSLPTFAYDTLMLDGDMGMFDLAIQAFGGSLRSDFTYGMCHPAIYWLAMMKYSKPADLVWDAFAGNGTLLYMAEMMGWGNVIASDLSPMRPDIIQADATLWHPGGGSVGLIVTQPPIPNESMSHRDYTNLMRAAFPNMFESLIPGHVMALVCCDVSIDGALVPLEYTVDSIMQTLDCRLIGRTQCDFYVGKRASYIRYKAYSAIKHGRFVPSRDTVLFYQKAGYDDRR